MKLFLLFLGFFSLCVGAMASTVEVPVPDGVTEIEVQYKLPVPPDQTPPPGQTPPPDQSAPPPPDVEPPVVDTGGQGPIVWPPAGKELWVPAGHPDKISDPERRITRWQAQQTAPTPSWVPPGAHFYITEAMSKGTRQEGQPLTKDSAGKGAFVVTIFDTHDFEIRYHNITIPDDAEGKACITNINRIWPYNPGQVVRSAPHYKTGDTYLLCDALPRDGAFAWLLAYGPGEHALPANVRTRYPLVIEGVRKNDVNLATINCLYKNMFGGDRAFRSKACVGGRYSGDLTVKNIDIYLARFGDDGLPLEKYRGLPNDSFRAIMPGDGHLLVENVNIVGAKNGVQGAPAKSWTFKNVRIENANFKGTVGKYHGIYTAAMDLLLIEDSYIHVRAGHPVKSRAKKTIIRRTSLKEGSGDTGAAFNTDSAQEVIMEDVTMIQGPSKGNAQIFSIGSAVSRCRDTGHLDLKNVTIIDTDPRGYPRFRNVCGRTEFIDRGGNTYQWMDNPPRNLFGSDGRMDLSGVQP